MEQTPATQEIQRGAHAAEALANPLIAEALGAWETEIVEAWKRSPLRDAEGRERLRLMLEAAQHFRSHLERTIQTGELQKTQIQAQRQKLTPVQRLRGYA